MIRENENFLALCNEFEGLVRHTYGLEEKDSAYYYLAGLDEFDQYREAINFIRGLRNLLVHNRQAYNKEPAIIVQDGLMDKLSEIMDKVENPVRARDVMTRDIVWIRPEDKVDTVLTLMRTKDLSRLPVMQNGKLAGVFSEHTFFGRVADRKAIDRNETVKEYLSEIRLDHPDQERYLFCPENEPVWKLEEQFFDKKKKRLAAVFVQDKNKKVTGILTIYDLAKEELDD